MPEAGAIVPWGRGLGLPSPPHLAVVCPCVADAQHELTSDSVGLALAWLEAGGQLSLEEVQRVEERWGEQRGG